MRKTVTFVMALALIAASGFAGGALESFDITAGVPSPIPGHIKARVIPIFWDARSIPVRFSMNTTLNPIPNPLGTSFLTVAQAQAALQESFDAWNNLPTSYIDMRITATTGNLGVRGFDMVNELTFRTAASFNAIASSPSVNFITDIVLEDGDLIDNDADSDVSSAITVAMDVDGDGDIEFPAGFYKAGTILENDVQFNTKTSNGLRFTVDPASLDTTTRSVDLKTVAVHEFGHSHGLSHSMDNQISASNGDGATMYPFIDTGDPASELAQSSLSDDDIAWSSYFYQEGSASSGPAALQPGDAAFASRFGIITGDLRHGVQNGPLAGGSVSAFTWDTGELVASGFSGTTYLSFNPATGGLFFLPAAADAIENGRYNIPVPKGSYSVGVEAVDGAPVPAGSISFTAQIGNFFGQMNFNEEFYNRNLEDKRELRLGQRKNVPVKNGSTASGIDIVTADSINISNFGTRDFIGFINSPAGRMYALQIPAAQLSTVNAGGDILIQAGAFETHVVDASVPVGFARALLTTGTVVGTTATIDLANPLQQTSGFLGQDGDFAPFYFPEPQDLGRRVMDGARAGTIQNLFLVLQIPTTTPFPGVSAQAPLIGLDGTGVPGTNDVPIFGRSFFSNDGGATWIPETRFNFRFSLITSLPLP